MFHRDFSPDQAKAIIASFSSSSSSTTGGQNVSEQSADSISQALRSISIEDLAQRQDMSGGATHDDNDNGHDPCESDDLASNSSGDGDGPSTESSDDENEEDDGKMETEELAPSGDEKMKSEKASKDKKNDDDSSKVVTNQNTAGEPTAVSQTDQNQTSQNGSNGGNNITKDDVIIPEDQEMDALGFANFSIAELTAVGEIEKPALLSEFQTSMYWLNLRLGLFYMILFSYFLFYFIS